MFVEGDSDARTMLKMMCRIASLGEEIAEKEGIIADLKAEIVENHQMINKLKEKDDVIKELKGATSGGPSVNQEA